MTESRGVLNCAMAWCLGGNFIATNMKFRQAQKSRQRRRQKAFPFGIYGRFPFFCPHCTLLCCVYIAQVQKSAAEQEAVMGWSPGTDHTSIINVLSGFKKGSHLEVTSINPDWINVKDSLCGFRVLCRDRSESPTNQLQTRAKAKDK